MLNVFENYILYTIEHGATPLRSLTLHNVSDVSVADWAAQSNLPVQVVATEPPELPWTSIVTPERRATLLLRKVGEPDQHQLLLQGQTWPWRSLLDNWAGGYFNKELLPVEKNTPGSTYIRFTRVFTTGELAGWLDTLGQTCLEVSCEGMLSAEIIDIIRSKRWLHMK